MSRLAFIHGYHAAFLWGAGLLTAALICAVVFIIAEKEDVPAETALSGS